VRLFGSTRKFLSRNNSCINFWHELAMLWAPETTAPLAVSHSRSLLASGNQDAIMDIGGWLRSLGHERYEAASEIQGLG
jgi:hypothetical protein